MMRFNQLPFILFIFISSSLFANDGAFRGKGNHLIPIVESDIRVQKEILTLKKIRHDYMEVTVYYEFFNPKEAKTLTVGFEAISPSGDVDASPVNGGHPHMQDFTVEVNGKMLNHNTTIVDDSLYAKNGKITSINWDTHDGPKGGNWVDFFYVYHFDAHFKKGLNVIKHTYTYDLSGGVCVSWAFDYVLTAANRWGNKQIDDFTLIIDSGEFETFDIAKTFFKSNSEWIINGFGKVIDHKGWEDDFYSRFHLQKGTLVFESNNFHPSGELSLISNFCTGDVGTPYSYNNPDWRFQKYKEEEDPLKRKIYKNLPFARRGYIFKTKAIQEFYEKEPWYIPNPNYKPDVEKLHEKEKKWIEEFK